MAKYNVGVLCPLPRDRYSCQQLLANGSYNFVFIDSDLQYSSRSAVDEETSECIFDMNEYVDKVCNAVKDSDLHILLATRDVADLVQAAVVTRLQNSGRNLRGPSVLSIYAALNKIVTRKILDARPIPFQAISLQSQDDMRLQYPVFVKPSCASCSQLGFKCNDEKDLHDALQKMRDEIPVFSAYLKPFLEEHLLLHSLPLSIVDGKCGPIALPPWVLDPGHSVLCEQFQPRSIFKVTVDGCVVATPTGHQIVLWGVSDNNYDRRPGREYAAVFDNVTFPSRFYDVPSGSIDAPSLWAHEELRVVEKLQRRYKEIARRMIALGFENQFMDAEFFVEVDLEGLDFRSTALRKDRVVVRLMEVNSRMFPQMAQVYQASLHSGNQYEALIQILLGAHFEGDVDVESDKCAACSVLAGKQELIARPSFKGVIGGNFYVNLVGVPLGSKLRACDVLKFASEDDILRECSLLDPTLDEISTTLLNIEYKFAEGDLIESNTSTVGPGVTVAQFNLVSRGGVKRKHSQIDGTRASWRPDAYAHAQNPLAQHNADAAEVIRRALIHPRFHCFL